MCDQHIRDDDNCYKELEFDREKQKGYFMEDCQFLVVFIPNIWQYFK